MTIKRTSLRISLLMWLIVILLLFFNKLNNYKNLNNSLKEKNGELIDYNKELNNKHTDLQNKYKNTINELEDIKKENIELNKKIKTLSSRSFSARKNIPIFDITAYDLSVQCCGKKIGSKGYGITASGFNLSGHTWDSARVIAADPKILPIDTKVKLTFVDKDFQKYNGIYTVKDTGSAVKGNRIDFFMGDFRQEKPAQQTLDFAKRKVYVEVINK